MSLPQNLFALAFRQQKLGIMLTAIMAIMVYLATLATAVQTSLAHVTSAWGNDLQGRMTVEIPAPNGEDAKSQSNRIKQVMDTLKSMPELEKVEKLPDDDIARLLKPWISDSSVLKSLPLPTLIDVQALEGTSIEAETLHKKLSVISSDLKVDNHADWLKQLLLIVRSLSVVAGLMVLLTGTTLAIAIALICRAAMALQHETIELLHIMGATDMDIVKQFQIHTRRLSLPAAAAGFLLALLTIIVLSGMFGHFLGHAPSVNISWFMFGSVVAIVPLAAIAVAVITARISILSLLRRMP